MTTSPLSLTFPDRASATLTSPRLPDYSRIWYAMGMLEHIVRVGGVIPGGAA